MLHKDDDDTLTFTKAIELARETGDVAQVAKETIYRLKHHSLKPVHAVRKKQNEATTPHNSERNPAQNSSSTCLRCGNTNHKSCECRYKQSTCNYCKKKGHLA